MNILHINQSDIIGGAGIAAYRLHNGLIASGNDSRILAGKVKTESPKVAAIRGSRKETLLYSLTSRLGLNYLNIFNSFYLDRDPFYQEADLLNFHNIHADYFNYLALPKLVRNKPAVYTLHDMWSFTGHCAYSLDCERWKTGCGKCPHPDVYPSIKRDNTRLEWKLKKWSYSNINLNIVTPSRWLKALAEQSMLSSFQVHHIPYGIDTDIYHPMDKDECKRILGIPPERTVVMFCSQYVSDPRKGSSILMESLKNLPVSLKKNILLMLLGNGGESISTITGIDIFPLGYVDGDNLKAVAFSAADLFILPTKADNLPVVLQESMACGTPMVSVNIGGVSELVRPNITGYLAEPENSDDFKDKIIQILTDRDLLTKMGETCRKIAVDEYSIKLQVDRYLALYKKIVANYYD